MGLPSTPSPPHLYPQALQLKLYQAFIFSVPILFSIILLLLFYLFYLKRRASSLSSSSPTRTWRLNQATPTPFGVDIKEDFKDKLPIIIFDEDVRSKDSQCCVCLGDFEFKEQLHQIPPCNHVFHIDCINHWLQANTTCPLCRCSVLLSRKSNSDPPIPFNSLPQIDADSNHHLQLGSEELISVSWNLTNFSSENRSRQIEGSTSRTTCLTETGGSQDSSISMDNGLDYLHQESVV